MRSLSLLALSMPLLLGCAGETALTDTPVPEPQPAEAPIAFAGASNPASRAMLNTTEDLHATGFAVFGVKSRPNETGLLLFNNQSVTWYNNWTYTPLKYWDTTSGTTYHFAAYAPTLPAQGTPAVAYDATGGALTFTGIPQWQPVADTNGTGFTDLLVARDQDGPATQWSDGTVHFTFIHQLALVEVYAQKAGADATQYQMNTLTIGGPDTGMPADAARTLTHTFSPEANQWDAPTGATAAKELFSGSVACPADGTKVLLSRHLVVPFNFPAQGTAFQMHVNYNKGNEATDRTVVLNDDQQRLTGFQANNKYAIVLKVGAEHVTAEVLYIQQWSVEQPADDDVYNW